MGCHSLNFKHSHQVKVEILRRQVQKHCLGFIHCLLVCWSHFYGMRRLRRHNLKPSVLVSQLLQQGKPCELAVLQLFAQSLCGLAIGLTSIAYSQESQLSFSVVVGGCVELGFLRCLELLSPRLGGCRNPRRWCFAASVSVACWLCSTYRYRS